MRELLQQALKELREYRLFVEEDTKPTHLEQAIEAALSRSKWVKVADGLPVVPEGQYVAKFWVADRFNRVHKLRIFAHDSKELIGFQFQPYAHYMPRQDDTPAPPEDL